MISELVSTMAGYDATDEDYSRMASNLRTLLEAKAMEPKPERISLNTVAVVAGNLLGIAMILIFERKNVISTKSLGLLMKPRT